MATEMVDLYSFACPASAPFFGYFGAASAMALANLGAAYGTAKAGAGIAGMGVSSPHLVMKALIPVVMAGVVGIYGLIIAVIISTKGTPPPPYLASLLPLHTCPSSSLQTPERYLWYALNHNYGLWVSWGIRVSLSSSQHTHRRGPFQASTCQGVEATE